MVTSVVGTVTLPTDWGLFTACFTERGLTRLRFPDASPSRHEAEPDGTASVPSPARLKQWVGHTQRALEMALCGKPLGKLPPLDWPPGSTPFQIAVWRALREIPVGCTVTYGTFAARLGRPHAARAVGGACGANPIPVLVPCHRVMAANGRLGGFSAGLDWKRRLLAVEANEKLPWRTE
jgi:O-6-methylguanine DNA methyltransferase